MTGNFKCDIHCAATTANGRMSADPPAAPPPVLTESARIKAYIARLERDGIARVKMFIVITIAYLIFWGPLFLVTLFSYGDYKTETPSTSHEVTLHVAFVHAFVNPTLFLVLHKGLRKATVDLLCCNFRSSASDSGRGSPRPPPLQRRPADNDDLLVGGDEPPYPACE